MPFAAGLALLGFSFVNFLNHQSYPLLRAELAYLYAGLVLVCAAMALLYDGQRRWGQAFLEALLIAAFIDLNLESLWLTAAGFLASLSLVIATRRSLLPLAAIMGSVMLLTSLMGIGRSHHWIETKVETPQSKPQSQLSADSNRPAILHLILDEHGGFEGFPNRHPAADKMKADLRRFYSSRGFSMFGRAYSEHHETANSIPHVLNFGLPTAAVANPKRTVSVSPNRYLTGLREQGYRLRLYQSDYVNLCEAVAPATCTTFQSGSAGALLETSLEATDRAQMLLFKFLALSDVLKDFDRASTTLLEYLLRIPRLGPPLQRLGYSGSVASLLMMDRLAKDLRNAQPGEAYFAHLLVPHFPWVAEPDCTVRPLEKWDREIIIEPSEVRELAYFDQVRCTTKKVDLLLRSLAQSPSGLNSIVVVHSDHGSRITELVPHVANYRQNSREDFIAGFSTLFVVRSPHIGLTYEERPISVADLLRQLAASNFRELPRAGSKTPSVYLSDTDWRPRRKVPFPPGW